MGFYMSLWQAGLKSIPGDVLEAGSLDGCNKTQQIFKIIFLCCATTSFRS